MDTAYRKKGAILHYIERTPIHHTNKNTESIHSVEDLKVLPIFGCVKGYEIILAVAATTPPDSEYKRYPMVCVKGFGILLAESATTPQYHRNQDDI